MPTSKTDRRATTLVPPVAVLDGSTLAEQRYDDALRADPAREREASRTFRAALADRKIDFGGSPLPTSIKPHFIRRSDNDAWTSLLGRMLEALADTAEELRNEPDFRRTGPFRKEAWDLFDIDPGYSRPAVVCRPDVVWSGSRIGLLEMNADSPAMMLYADVVQELQRELYPMRQLEERHRFTFDRRIPALLDALLATYREWGGSKTSPTIAVIDWPNQKTASEQEQLARAFTALGCPSFFCSPDQLEVRGGVLYGRGEPIDIIQRRVLFPEIVERQDELGPFLTAYRERLACVVNPLRSYLVGCKAVLAEFCRRRFQLGADARDAVDSVLPRTSGVSDMDPADLCDRSRWVLKPAFGSGGNGVVIGRYTDEDDWQRALADAQKGRWIVQSYLPIPRYQVPLTTGVDDDAKPLYANWNPFFFGGVAAGGIARVSSDPVVGISARGALLPSVIVDDE